MKMKLIKSWEIAVFFIFLLIILSFILINIVLLKDRVIFSTDDSLQTSHKIAQNLVNSNFKLSTDIDIEVGTTQILDNVNNVSDISQLDFVSVDGNSVVINPTQKSQLGTYNFSVEKDNHSVDYKIKIVSKNIDMDKLGQRIFETLGNRKDNYGIYLHNLGNGQTFKHQANEQFPVASLIKIPYVMLTLREIDKGNITLEDTFTVQDRLKHPINDRIARKDEGEKVSFDILMDEAIRVSSNTAQYHLRDFIEQSQDGKYINEIVRDDLGLNPYFEFPLIATPTKVWKAFDGIYNSSLISEESSAYLIDKLKTTAPDLRLGIPAGVPEGVEVANKVGFLFGGIEGSIYNDGGIVYGEDTDYILVILNNRAPEYPYGKDMIREISKVVYEELN